MNYKQPYNTVRTGPEAHGARRLRLYMRSRGWYTKKLHGGKYQSGLPDLLAIHPIHGIKWIETKAPGEKLRSSQRKEFIIMEKFGQKIFVLEDEKDYLKLFMARSNWMEYV